MQPVTNKWTCCSNADFKIVYDQWQPFCLEACSDGPPTTTTTTTTATTTTTTTTSTTTTTTTTTPPPQCPPDFEGDGYCDDCHNTVEGNYDGGDCCPPHADFDNNSWNSYCTKCECLQPTCEDKWPTNKCSKKCNAKKCKKSGSCKKNCKNTCNLCGGEEPCEDQKSSKYCKKALKKGKCNKVWKKCQKTCDRCD